MRTYHAIYKGKKIEVQANTSYEAQKIAAKILNVKKTYDIVVILVDITYKPTF